MSYFIILSLGFLFAFSTPKAFAEVSPKPTWLTKTYCFFYKSRCVADLSVISTTTPTIATSTKSSESKINKPEIKETAVTTSPNLISWIRSLRANKIEAKTICVEDVCVNKSQFLKMVQNANSESPVFTVSFTTGDGSTTVSRTITR